MDSGDDMHFDSGNESSSDEQNNMGTESEIEDYPYEVLSADEIVQHMTDTVRDVNIVVQIPANTTRMLLNHFKWDKEKLIERYYDSDLAKLYAMARVIDPFKKPVPQKSRFPRCTAPGTEECEICFTVLPNEMLTGLECGHIFCMQCWSEYLTAKVMEEGLGQTIACAAHACDILVDDDSVMRLVRDQKVRFKYQQLITNSFVKCNRLLRWCPSPDCSYAVKVQYVEPQPVSCRCGHSFCFGCGEIWHDPVGCSLLRKWIKKFDDDSETVNWMAANTKDCPKCNVMIEKNGGCNHMVCRNTDCEYDFCWICLRSWGSHGDDGYNCNKFDGDAANVASDARFALQRYLFYCNRYMNHMKSLRFESKLYTSIKEKMEEMQQHNMSWIEVQFLKKAVDILCGCRQTLMYTYVFAYNLRKNNQSVIFEDNQRDLESATETLSEYLERDITSENLTDIKLRVQDKYRYCDRRRKVLLEHVHEGYKEDWWLYSDQI